MADEVAMKDETIRTMLALSFLFMGPPAFAQSNERPVNWKDLPEPFHTDSARNRPEVVVRPDGATLQLPEGFTIEEYMNEFVRPRFMMLGPSNEIILSDSGSRESRDGIVYVLKGGSKTKIIEGLDRPYGLELHDGWLYVAETTSVKRYRYDPDSMKVTGVGEEVIPLEKFDEGHWTRTLLFDRSHEKLYLTVGSRSNIDLDEDPMRAALHRYNPDGGGHETVATGLRNIIGLRWYPGTDDLWAAVQERDGLGDDLVPDYVVTIEDGGFYGWPISYIGPHREPRHENVDEAKVKSTLYPDVLLGAHVAVLDILFYTGEQFPAQYRGGMFLAFHGSWNRAERIGYEVAFIPFENGEPTAGPESFLTGWMLDPKKREVWGRPVGLLQSPDGSLIVSDDGGGKLWKISFSLR
ncbi:MAG TPA: PQQ-dependent sugar dehydrogenase [Vicinamibacteria bacterium]|nr:PQQ-dependent sugar dehydrogenase [Vicinamibacteria bacterium]